MNSMNSQDMLQETSSFSLLKEKVQKNENVKKRQNKRWFPLQVNLS